MDWLERYQEQMQAFEDDFARDLMVAAQELVVRCFVAELELWATELPDGF